MNPDLPPFNPARRRLARGGIAVPVVLASVISRNAFAAVPYQCTVSGKLSGNMSLFGPNKDASDTCTMRAGRNELTGLLQDDKTSFASVFGQTFYANGDNTAATKLAGDPFKEESKDKAGDDKGMPSKAPQDATLYQVLKLDQYVAGAKPKDPEFARMAIVAYRNATAGPSDLYPLTKQQVVAMFKAAVAGREYEGATTMGPFKWQPSDVHKYFEHLYH